MSRPDKVTGRVRGVVAAATDLAGVFGPTGLEDLVLVTTDSNGELVVATQGEAFGLVVTTEGKADSSVAGFLTAGKGTAVTVYTHCEIVGDGASAGDEYWSTAAGDVVTTVPSTPIQKVGVTLASHADKGGTRSFYNIVPYSK